MNKANHKEFKRIPVSENFFLDEYIDPHTYFNEPDNGLSKMDKRVFEMVQKLRELKGSSMSVNNWWSYYEDNKYRLDLPEGDKNRLTLEKLITNIEKSNLSKWSGYRSPRCKIGGKLSAHRQGKAADPKGNQKELMKLVRQNIKDFYELGLRRLEDISITIGWLHMDTWEKNTKPNSVRVVDLTKCTETITW